MKTIEAFENGWDYGVEQYEKTFGSNETTADYWKAYKFMKNNDADGGECFKRRQKAVEKLIKELTEKENYGNA